VYACEDYDTTESRDGFFGFLIFEYSKTKTIFNIRISILIFEYIRIVSNIFFAFMSEKFNKIMSVLVFDRRFFYQRITIFRTILLFYTGFLDVIFEYSILIFEYSL
jgi:hypothetical protein